MEKGRCEQCNTYTVLDKHHVLPKKAFFGRGRIVKLCPNCHRLYHDTLGKPNLSNADEVFHEFTFWHWFFTSSLVALVMVGFYWLLAK